MQAFLKFLSIYLVLRILVLKILKLRREWADVQINGQYQRK
jgi:hypothetical protein